MIKKQKYSHKHLTSSQLKTSTCLPNRPPRALIDSVLPVPAGPYGLPPRPFIKAAWFMQLYNAALWFLLEFIEKLIFMLVGKYIGVRMKYLETQVFIVSASKYNIKPK